MSKPRDWADDTANELIGYLRLCKTPQQELELAAAYLRRERVAGKMDAINELSPIITGEKQ